MIHHPARIWQLMTLIPVPVWSSEVFQRLILTPARAQPHRAQAPAPLLTPCAAAPSHQRPCSCALCSLSLSTQPHLAVGSNDYYISVYSVEKRVR